MKKIISHSLVYLLLPICTAMAQSKQDTATAKKLFEAATVYYNTQDYEKALSGYQDAYKVAPLPFILFNIAQCYRFLGRHQEARDAYTQYLRDEPKSEYKAEVEQKIKDIDTTIAEEKRLAEEKAREAASQAASTQALSATLPTKEADDKPTEKWRPFYLSGGLGGAALALGVTSLVMRSSIKTLPDNNDKIDRRQATLLFAIPTDILLISTAVTGIFGYKKFKKQTSTQETVADKYTGAP